MKYVYGCTQRDRLGQSSSVAVSNVLQHILYRSLQAPVWPFNDISCVYVPGGNTFACECTEHQSNEFSRTDARPRSIHLGTQYEGCRTPRKCHQHLTSPPTMPFKISPAWFSHSIKFGYLSRKCDRTSVCFFRRACAPRSLSLLPPPTVARFRHSFYFLVMTLY